MELDDLAKEIREARKGLGKGPQSFGARISKHETWIEKIEAEQARRPHSSESSTPRSSERNSLILRPQSGHLGVRKRRSTGKDASPPKSGLGTALEAGVVLDSAPSPASSTWRLPYGLRAPGSRASS